MREVCKLRASLLFSSSGCPCVPSLSDITGRKAPLGQGPSLSDFITGAVGDLERPKHHLVAMSLEAGEWEIWVESTSFNAAKEF